LLEDHGGDGAACELLEGIQARLAAAPAAVDLLLNVVAEWDVACQIRSAKNGENQHNLLL
jgi:hypothetical protein